MRALKVVHVTFTLGKSPRINTGIKGLFSGVDSLQ